MLFLEEAGTDRLGASCGQQILPDTGACRICHQLRATNHPVRSHCGLNQHKPLARGTGRETECCRHTACRPGVHHLFRRFWCKSGNRLLACGKDHPPPPKMAWVLDWLRVITGLVLHNRAVLPGYVLKFIPKAFSCVWVVGWEVLFHFRGSFTDFWVTFTNRRNLTYDLLWYKRIEC
jgi:hypothetical protein